MIDSSPSAGFARRYRIAPALLAAVAAIPVAYIALRIVAACRNIAFWDEFDSVLTLVLRLDEGLGWREFATRVFHLDSEHRTVTSRLIVSTLYGLTGSVNFDVISALGNLSLVALCAILIAAVRPLERRVRLGVLLALGMFQLEHYETFLWSGASIDHFTVIMLAGGAIAAIAQGGRLGSAGAGLFAVLATFTLAHGCVVWPIGAAMLWQARRWRELALWSGLALVALGLFFHGFQIDPSHRIHDFSPAGLGRLTEFWLALLGGPLTFGARAWAPLFGAVLVAMIGGVVARGAARRHQVILPMTLFAVVSLALVAFGRFEVAGAQIQSRYLVLASLAWSLTAFMWIEELTTEARPYRVLAWSLPALAAFNVIADVRSVHDADTFLWSRDYAAVRFKQYGEEGHANGFRLHPSQDTAKFILARTTARGIYHLPLICNPAAVPTPVPNTAMVTYITDLTVNNRAIGFEGWAMFPHQKSRPGEIHVVLRSERSFLVFSTFSVARPDVAKAFNEPLWHDCGYNFVLERKRLPTEDFQIGFIISDGDRSEIKMTDKWVKLASSAAAAQSLATSQ